MDVISIVSWSSDPVDKSILRLRNYVWGRCHFIQKQFEDGKAKWQNFKCPFVMENYWGSMDRQLILSGISSHDLRHWRFFRRSRMICQDMTPPKSILRKGTDMPRPIQRVKFSKTIARHTKIRDQNPSLGYICPGEPHQRSPNAPKFEDRSQEETEWQERGAREAAWKLAKSVSKLKEQKRATFFSPSENRCLPASNLKPEEREFVVDSGASMHMISKKS